MITCIFLSLKKRACRAVGLPAINVERQTRQGQDEPGQRRRCKTAQDGLERANVICPTYNALAILSGEAQGKEATGQGIIYDPGLAARLNDIMSGMLEMEGWAMIHPDGLSEDEDLRRYIDLAIMFCAALPPKSGR